MNEATDLHRAALEGNVKLVKELIAKGADRNAKSEDGSAPLHFVASQEVARLLIANGADIHAK